MRVIEISNKTYLVRHWFKWYRVQKAGRQWENLKIKAEKNQKPPTTKTIEQIQQSLEERAGQTAQKSYTDKVLTK